MKKLRRDIYWDAFLIAGNLCGLLGDSCLVWLNFIGLIALFPDFLARCRLAASVVELDRFCASIITKWGDDGRARLWAAITGAPS